MTIPMVDLKLQYHSLKMEIDLGEEVACRCMSLPIFPEMTDEQVQLVAATVKEALLG